MFADCTAQLTIVVTAYTLVLMLTRPRGIGEAWFAAAGAVALILFGALPIDAPLRALIQTWEVLVFLAGMMLVTGVVERAGVIDVIAERIARICGPNIRVLYIAMLALAAVVTATMSLDITIILVTPILFAITRRRRIDPVPFLFACAFVANIGSLMLPVSNLTNLLLVNRLAIPFASFVGVMWIPNLVALGTTLVIFLWLFRDQLRPDSASAFVADETVPGVASTSWRTLVGIALIGVILGLLAAGFAGLPVWIPAATGAVLLVAAAVIARRIAVSDVVRDLSLSLFVFVIAMTMVVEAINTHVLGAVEVPVPATLEGQIAAGVIMMTLASNVINNVPATVIAGEVLMGMPAGPREIMAYAGLIGANIGPALTTYGSLATMLWLSIIRKRDVSVSAARYMRVSLLTVPVVLLTTSLSLWLILR